MKIELLTNRNGSENTLSMKLSSPGECGPMDECSPDRSAPSNELSQKTASPETTDPTKGVPPLTE